MKTIQVPEELKTIIGTSGGTVVYFYNDMCAPCVALRPKVQEMIEREFCKIELVFLNTAEFPELAASYSVFASPTIIVFFEGRETFRVSKYVSIEELGIKIRRYYTMLFE